MDGTGDGVEIGRDQSKEGKMRVVKLLVDVILMVVGLGLFNKKSKEIDLEKFEAILFI